jgi:hypothetical protein
MPQYRRRSSAYRIPFSSRRNEGQGEDHGDCRFLIRKIRHPSVRLDVVNVLEGDDGVGQCIQLLATYNPSYPMVEIEKVI